MKPHNYFMLSHNVAVKEDWYLAMIDLECQQNIQGGEFIKLMIDGLLLPEQLALKGGETVYHGTYLEHLMEAFKGRRHFIASFYGCFMYLCYHNLSV